MTLFRQIIAGFALFLLTILAVVLTISFVDSREYIENKLYTNAQNTASTLAVTMSQADGDVTKMSVMADAVFDTGYYRKIALTSMRGEKIFEKVREERAEVPAWFVTLVRLEVDSAFAQVSDGWRPLGMLEVTPDATESLEYLYTLFRKIVTVFFLAAAVGVLLIALMLKRLLKPLETMERQARGVLENRFLRNESIPSTLELRRVTMAINDLVERMEQMHRRLLQLTNRNRELEYKDPLTGVYNRRYFTVRYEEFVSAEDERSEGCVVMLRLCGVQEANLRIGFDRVNVIFTSLTHIVVEKAENDGDAVVARISGVELAVILPRLGMEEAREWAERVLREGREVLDSFREAREVLYMALTAVAYAPSERLSKVLSAADLALNDAALERKDAFRPVSFAHPLPLRKEEWRELLVRSLAERRYEARWRVAETPEGEELYRALHLDILSGEGTLPYRVYAPMLQQLDLFDRYAEALFGYLESENGTGGRRILVELPLGYLDSTHRFERFVDFAKRLRKRATLVAAVSQNELLRCENRTAEALAESLSSHGVELAVTRFDAERRMLDFLRRVRPRFVRMHAAQFSDMSETLKGTLSLLLRSIGAKLVVTGAPREERRRLADRGCDGFEE